MSRSPLFTTFACLLVHFGFCEVDAKPLKVFILAGQSNMQGHAEIRTFEHIGMDEKTAPLLAEMTNDDGSPRVMEDVWISYLSKDLEKNGALTAGFGAKDDKIGPEFTFGITIRKLLGEPVLLIKTAWGGKSLHTDFRPPSAGAYEFSEPQLEQFAKRGDDVEKKKAEKVEATGHYYRLMIDHVKKILGDVGSVVPGYDSSQGTELAGFVWFQGWNDLVDSGTYPDRDKPGGYDAYSEVMAHFIRDVRKDLAAPELPFVIGVLGVNGPTANYGQNEQRYKSTHQNFRDAMAAPAALPELKGNVAAVFTEIYWDPELQELTKRDEKLKQESRRQQKEQDLDGKAANALLEELRATEFTDGEREILEKGISNQAYHYLGSAKIMGGIGRAFAEAAAELAGASPDPQASVPAASAVREWTQASTGKQLVGELVKVEGGEITIRTERREIPIPLAMLVEEDRKFVADWQAQRAAPDPIPAVSTVDLPKIPEGIPDFTNGATIPREAKHDWTLGPTGARGWIYSNKLETSEARQIAVTEVESDSPADGVLEQGDVIVGVGGQPFSYDPRTELGKAIGLAEAGDGQLSLLLWRRGEVTDIEIPLKVLGSYSATAPFDCVKSKVIFEQGCEALAQRMKENPKAGNHITRSLNALALLASGEEKYFPLVREQVAEMSTFADPERRTYHSWFYGPITILVAEYIMATGDEEFLPELERLAMEIVRGQSAVGSWGHRFVQENGVLSGYGMMNAPGLPLTISLVLAREAGVSDPALYEAIRKSTLLLSFYTGKGSIPYGDHRPWTQTHDDNGKNGAAAVMFNLLGDTEGAEYFSRMATACHGAEREMGHTGNFFNMLWAMPSVALSGPNASGAWMEEFGWYYDLARKWDGTFQHQGPPQEKKDSYSGWDSSGAYLLAYAQPFRRIHLAGKTREVVPHVDQATAATLIADGRGWSPRTKDNPYPDHDEADLIPLLKSWSPTVRERAATALAKRDDPPVSTLLEMLVEDDRHARIGACQALAALKGKSAQAVDSLRKTLTAEDLWLRIEAAEALAAIGQEAMPAVPDLLAMLATHDVEGDPRAMQQRYLCFALFDRRDGLLRGSLEGVDREALFAAVREGLRNEDGRARGAIGTVYKNLDYEEIKPLLPFIVDAVASSAPSGIMFADGIRLSGLELLAQNFHKEGLDHFIDVLGVDRWGLGNRLPKCLKILEAYGGSAKRILPELAKVEKEIESNGKEEHLALLRETMRFIELDDEQEPLRTIDAGG